ncbi:MAG: helix-turn-helix domain-containing protein [Clostridia bacterium]|nr:helix-turn-helix domain-containing protein [Clostridia bacterium]
MNEPYTGKPYYEPEMKAKGMPAYPFSCHLQTYEGEPLMCAAHWHYAIEILYATQGNASVLLNGQLYPFQKGDMVLISTRDVHAIWGEPQTQYICIKFDPEILYTAACFAFESRYVLPFTMAKSAPQKVFPKEEIEGTHLPSIIFEIMDELSEQSYGFELAVRTNISRIFLWVLRNWHNKGLQLGSGTYKEQDMRRLQVIFDYVDKHYMEPLSVDQMSKLCNMSYSYFSRYFKAVIGKSFTDYLNYVRITEAEKLLLTTDKTVTEIAMETGFASTSYFISQFRQQKALSPGQYRLQVINLQ